MDDHLKEDELGFERNLVVFVPLPPNGFALLSPGLIGSAHELTYLN